MSEKIVAVDRAIDLLLYLYAKGEEMGISEISRDLDLPKSTIHRILSTLEAKDFVYKNIETNNYWLGIKLYSLGEAVKEKISLVDLMKPYVDELHNEIPEVVNVSVLNSFSSENKYTTTMVYKKSGDTNVLSVNPKLGSISDAHVSSVGKCLLAFNDEVDFEKLKNSDLHKYTEHTIVDYDELMAEIEDVREKGYAVDDQEQELGLFCIGAPVFDKYNNAVAALSLSGPIPRMESGGIQYKIDKLLETAKKITHVIKDMS